jgi:hypothetical protein
MHTGVDEMKQFRYLLFELNLFFSLLGKLFLDLIVHLQMLMVNGFKLCHPFS